MTREEVKAMLPAMLAYAAGKAVQYRRCESDLWHNTDSRGPLFGALEMESVEWRVRPEPDELWVVTVTQPDGSTTRTLWTTRAEAERQAERCGRSIAPGAVTVKRMREVAGAEAGGGE